MNIHDQIRSNQRRSILLVIIWAIGFIGYSAGGIIHILLVIAIIAVLLRVINGKPI